jgi:hypothetical protein
MANHRPPTLSIKELSQAVDHAVKIASQKHKVEFAPEFRINPGTIIGRQLLKADITVNQAQQLATDIAQHLSTAKVGPAAAAAPGLLPFEPAVFGHRNILICGFLPGPIWELRE